jgi:hypothetical protein
LRLKRNKILNFTAASMTPEQLEEARMRARQCSDRQFKGC